MKNYSNSLLGLGIAFGALLAAGPAATPAQAQNTSATIRDYGPDSPDYNVSKGYSSRLNGQIETFERRRYRERLEERRRQEYFKRFIDHDFTHRSRDVGGY